MLLQADSDDSDMTGRMPRLIRVFAVHDCGSNVDCMKFRLIIYLYFCSSAHSVGFIVSNEKKNVIFFKTSEYNLINYQIHCVFHVTFVNAAYLFYLRRDNI